MSTDTKKAAQRADGTVEPIVQTPKKCKACLWLSMAGYCRLRIPHVRPDAPCAGFRQDPFKLKPGEDRFSFRVSPNAGGEVREPAGVKR